jgi:hypothetical protein
MNGRFVNWWMRAFSLIVMKLYRAVLCAVYAFLVLGPKITPRCMYAVACAYIFNVVFVSVGLTLSVLRPAELNSAVHSTLSPQCALLQSDWPTRFERDHAARQKYASPFSMPRLEPIVTMHKRYPEQSFEADRFDSLLTVKRVGADSFFLPLIEYQLVRSAQDIRQIASTSCFFAFLLLAARHIPVIYIIFLRICVLFSFRIGYVLLGS